MAKEMKCADQILQNPFGTQVGGPNRISGEHRCTVRYEVNRTSQFLNHEI